MGISNLSLQGRWSLVSDLNSEYTTMNTNTLIVLYFIIQEKITNSQCGMQETDSTGDK